MNRIVFTLLALLFLPPPALPQNSRPHAEKWQQGVRYQIEAELDTTAEKLNGKMKIFYQNNSPDTLRKIFLQVPSNAFMDEENTAVKEMERLRRMNLSSKQGWNYKLTIQSLQFLSIGKRTSFPLQAYDFSDTILELRLPFALLPGDTLSLGLDFQSDFVKPGKIRKKARIPSDFVLWFPRLTVYDEEGWHAEPFHFMMEASDVYSEFAEMDVTLTVPGNFIVVGSGEIVEGDPGWQAVTADTSLTRKALKAWIDSTRTHLYRAALKKGPRRVRFHAEKVNNFDWSASRKFIHFQYDDKIPVHVFYRSQGDLSWLKTLLDRFKGVFAYLQDYFGPYPYPFLNLVEASGQSMADPMFALLLDEDYFALSYELSSIYFPGMVASNGVRESWLAKGLQVYMGKSYSEKMYGKKGYDVKDAQEDMNWLQKQYPLPSLDELFRNFSRLYMESGQNEPISKEIHKYNDPISALFNVYLKSDIFYEMLRFVVGDSVFKASTREVVQRYAFHHIKEKDLMAVFEEVYGQDLHWFFDQWLHRTPTVDYAKDKVKRYRRDDHTWVTEVAVKRKGDGIMPVEVELDLGNGKKLVKRWDGKDKSGIVVFKTEKKPKGVKLDPDDRIMDRNLLNNGKRRLEFRPDLPLLKYVHMPGDAILVLWRPLLDYNSHDSIRLGLRTRSSYRAFYHNLTVQGAVGMGSGELDGKIAYSQPLSRKSLMNRYQFMLRKNEGRFEADAHLVLNGSNGILTTSGRSLELGLNYSDLLNDAYTFRKVSNDTGQVRFDEWEDRNILLAYLKGRANVAFDRVNTEARFQAETALPGGDVQFTKLSGRLAVSFKGAGFKGTVRGNLATSFGPDRLPLQDQFRAEGAGARERFQHDIVKTGNAFGSFKRRYVEGGGFLRGYAGQPLPAERFATLNVEVVPPNSLLIFKFFGFYDTGRIWQTRGSASFTRSDAGLGLSFFGDGFNFFGGNLGLFSDLSAKLFFPIWLSDPPPGEKQAQFRWYVSLGKGL